MLGLLRCFGSPALRWSTTKEWDQMKRSKFSEEQVAYALRRITDETREWEVIAPPYRTAGGRIVHARVQRMNEPASWEIRSWDESKRISVKRTTAEEGK